MKKKIAGRHARTSRCLSVIWLAHLFLVYL